jgi:Carboxypeptidase regulatory-like domain
MKTLSIFKAALLVLLSAAGAQTFAGNIMGQVTDTTNHKPLSDATVVLDCKGTQRSFTTNQNGYYYASNIPAGDYLVVVVNLSNTYKLTVSLAENETREINFMVSGVLEMKPVEVDGGKSIKPLIDVWNVEQKNLSIDDVKSAGVTSIHDIAETTGNGVVEIGGQDYVRGARAGSLSYYIDGGLVLGSPETPLCGLGLYHIYTGYIPPKYGDTVGGVVVMETRSFFTEHR